MDIVLDSVCVNHLSRDRVSSNGQPVDRVTAMVKMRRLRLILDPDKAIADEWQKTAGADLVQTLLVAWGDAGGLVVIRKHGEISRELRKKLEQLGFRDTVDKAIVRTCVCTTDRVIVSDDSDFFDPQDKSSVGDGEAPVADLLWKHEKIVVRTLGQFMKEHWPVDIKIEQDKKTTRPKK